MKKKFSLIFFLLLSNILFGQNKTRIEPFIIKGQIINSPEKEFVIAFSGNEEQIYKDTIRLDSTGRFYLKSYKVYKPQQVVFGEGMIKISGLFVAPGYDLTITGDAKDNITFHTSKTISGIGSVSNRYRIILDSIMHMRKSVLWHELKEADFLSDLEKDQRLKDSLTLALFKKPCGQDKYLKHFGRIIKIENKFNKLYRLLVSAYWNNYSVNQTTSFLRKHFDNKILDNIYRDEYFISPYYRGVIRNEWLDYLVQIDYQKDSNLRKDEVYGLQKVTKTFRGKIKESTLYARMEYDFSMSKSLKEVGDYAEQFEPFISSFKNNTYKELLRDKIQQIEKDLISMQIGKPAPLFVLKSNQGNTHSLSDFQGKVVYLDFWASWCTPCREENPSFKVLHEKYKNDNRIAFISIGVHDDETRWRKAIEEDKPTWLQLLDKDNSLWKLYGASAIPRFVLIDKKGNIVDVTPPRPSSAGELEKLLNIEIEKY